MKIQIDKGVPAPQIIKRKCKYPFRDMILGDSFFVKDDIDPKRMQQKVAAAACMFVRKNRSYKFKTQAFDTGVRIWRVE